jgi:hypothetical protein
VVAERDSRTFASSELFALGQQFNAETLVSRATGATLSFEPVLRRITTVVQ